MTAKDRSFRTVRRKTNRLRQSSAHLSWMITVCPTGPIGVPLAGLRAKQFEELADELFGCFFGHVVPTVDHCAA